MVAVEAPTIGVLRLRFAHVDEAAAAAPARARAARVLRRLT